MEKNIMSLYEKMQSLKDSITGVAAKRLSSTSHILNGFAHQKYYKRIRILDKILSIILLAQILLFHCYYQLDLIDDSWALWFLRAGEFCGLLACGIIIVRYVQIRQQQIYMCGWYDSNWHLIMKIFFILIMPYEFINERVLDFTYINTSEGIHTIEYIEKANYVLLCFCSFKTSYFIMVTSVRSRYMAPSSVRISRLYGFQPGLIYCLKTFFKDHPVIFIGVNFIVSFLVFCFTFRIAQNVVYNAAPKDIYADMAWMTVVTMTTVGYGDFTPKTQLGRIIATCCLSWGVIIVSVMVVVLMRAFSMDRNESQALSILNKLKRNIQFREVAGQYLRQSLWRVWQSYKFKMCLRDNMKQRKAMIKFRLFRRLRDMTKISHSDTEFENELSKQFERAFINLENLKSNNLKIISYLNDEYIFKEQDIDLEEANIKM